MLKELAGFARQLFNILQTQQKHYEEIKDIRQDITDLRHQVTDLARVVERLAFEVQKDRENSEREIERYFNCGWKISCCALSAGCHRAVKTQHCAVETQPANMR